MWDKLLKIQRGDPWKNKYLFSKKLIDFNQSRLKWSEIFCWFQKYIGCLCYVQFFWSRKHANYTYNINANIVKIKNIWEIFLIENFKSIYQSQNKTKSFSVKNISQIIFIFLNLEFHIFYFFKKSTIWELFQKRFANGICDLGGGPHQLPIYTLYICFAYWIEVTHTTCIPESLGP